MKEVRTYLAGEGDGSSSSPEKNADAVFSLRPAEGLVSVRECTAMMDIILPYHTLCRG